MTNDLWPRGSNRRETMKLGELSERSGVPPRTIRLYIARGLMPGPSQAGKNASYGEPHLETLKRIRRLQARGLTLSQIRLELVGRSPGAELPIPASLASYPLTPDVTVLVNGNCSAWRLREIRRALAEFKRRLSSERGKEGDNERNG